MTCNQEQKKSIKTNPQMAQMLDLLEKNFRAAIINILRQKK